MAIGLLIERSTEELRETRGMLEQYVDALERSRGAPLSMVDWATLPEDDDLTYLYEEYGVGCGTACCAAGWWAALYSKEEAGTGQYDFEAHRFARELTDRLILQREATRHLCAIGLSNVLFGAELGHGEALRERLIRRGRWFLRRVDAVLAERYVMGLTRAARRRCGETIRRSVGEMAGAEA